MKKKYYIIISILILSLIGGIYFYNKYKITPVGKNSIPIITYHSISDDWQNPYVVKVKKFENMVKSLKDNGFTFLSIKDLDDIINKKQKLPKNPVFITLDDGYEDGYTNVFPILKKYNAKATFFLIGSYVGKDKYLNWEQIKEMSDSNLADFENHTYNLHDLFIYGENKGKTWLSAKLPEETDEHYFNKIKNDLVWNNYLINKYTNKLPIAISYPGGMINKTIISAAKDAKLKLGFIGADKDASKLDDKLNPFEIKRFNMAPDVNNKEYVKALRSDND